MIWIGICVMGTGTLFLKICGAVLNGPPRDTGRLIGMGRFFLLYNHCLYRCDPVLYRQKKIIPCLSGKQGNEQLFV